MVKSMVSWRNFAWNMVLPYVWNSITTQLHTFKQHHLGTHFFFYFSTMHQVSEYGMWQISICTPHKTLQFSWLILNITTWVRMPLVYWTQQLSKNASRRQPFKKLNILPAPSQYILSVFLFLTKYKDQFTTNSQMHKITTWQTSDLYMPAANLTIYQKGWRIKAQLDVICYFISLLMCSTCFGH